VKARATFLVASTIAIVASVLVGARALSLPPVASACLAFYALFVAPGIAIDRLVFRSRGGTLEAVCRVSAAGFVFDSIVVCMGFIPGVAYRVMSPVAGAAAVTLLLAAWAKRGSEGAREGPVDERGAALAGRRIGVRELAAVVVLFAACFILFYKSGTLGFDTDALDHLSYIRRGVDAGTIFPRDSFYRGGDGAGFDVRKGAWDAALSLFVFQSRTAPDLFWRLVPSLLAFTALSAFLFLGVELLGSVAYAAVGLLFMLVFYAAGGVAWLTKAAYGRNAMQILFWMNAAFLLRYYRVRDARYLAAIFFIAAAGCAFHLVFPMLAATSLLGLLFYVLWSGEGRSWRGAYGRSVLVEACGLAIPLAVRACSFGASMNIIHTHRQGMLVFSRKLAMIDPAELARGEGSVFFFALLMLPFFFLVAPRRRRALVFALTIVPVLLVVNPVVAPVLESSFGYLHYRLLDAAPLMFFLGLAVIGLGARVFGRGRLRSPSAAIGRAFAMLALVLFLWFPLRTSLVGLGASVKSVVCARAEPESSLRAGVEELARIIPAHSVVVSDPVTSYAVSAFTDDFVVVVPGQHGSPTDTLALERLEAVRDLMSPVRPLAASAQWLRRSGAGFVIVNTDPSAAPDFFETVLAGESPLTAKKFCSCPGAMRDAGAAKGLVLYEISRDSLARTLDWCTAPVAGPATCDTACAGEKVRRDAGSGVFLERVALCRKTVAPGDTLGGDLCWIAPEKIAYGLPIVLTIRIETAFPKGRLFADWYSKPYRKLLERRLGIRYRATWNEPLAAGFALPDQWEPGRLVGQRFALVIPERMASGVYELRVRVSRQTYLPNRTIADYFSDNDSFEGIRVGTITVGPGRPQSGAALGGVWNAAQKRGEE
jgi:hypothetical protein